jgi:hypothetical protein
MYRSGSWGDLDTWGLQMLATARGDRPQLRALLMTRIDEQTERSNSLPRVDHNRAGRFEIGDVARYDRHPVDKSRCRNDRTSLTARIRYMQLRATQGDCLI